MGISDMISLMFKKDTYSLGEARCEKVVFMIFWTMSNTN